MTLVEIAHVDVLDDLDYSRQFAAKHFCPEEVLGVAAVDRRHAAATGAADEDVAR